MRRLNMRIHIWFLAFLILAGPVCVLGNEGDIVGSSDHPDLGRFGGSVISGYDSKDFDEYPFHTGPLAAGEDSIKHLEGAVEQIAYTTPAGASVAEVYRNYKIKLEEAGYEILFECENKSCGGTEFAYALKVLPIPRMVLDPFHYRYLAAQSEKDGQVSSIAIVVSPDSAKRIRSQVSVILSGTLENKMVDATQMQSGLLEDGHIALYGIYFDTDKAEIKAESKPTLDEIDKLLKANPQLHIILVGHTDNQGAYDYNKNLSRRRAESVADALVTGYGIDSARLKPDGVGYLAPVSSNDNEAGRALNRRVELVKAN